MSPKSTINRTRIIHRQSFLAIFLATFTLVTLPLISAAQSTTGPVALQVNNLPTPLGIDDPAPLFSWQLQDAAQGAAQTAYQVQVASSPELLAQNKPDVWDS